MTSPGTSIELGNVRLTADGLHEVDGHRPVVTIRRSDVRRIELRYGWRSERPWLSLVFGTALVVAGLAPVPLVVRSALEGHVLWPLALAFPFAFVGAYLIYDTLRKGHFLLVELARDRRKLCFVRGVSRAEVSDFLAEARERLGYTIDED